MAVAGLVLIAPANAVMLLLARKAPWQKAFLFTVCGLDRTLQSRQRQTGHALGKLCKIGRGNKREMTPDVTSAPKGAFRKTALKRR